MQPNQSAVAIREPKGKDVTGTLFVPKTDFSGLTCVRVEVTTSKVTKEAEWNFLVAKEAHFNRLVLSRHRGRIWFRHQMHEAEWARVGKETVAADRPQP